MELELCFPVWYMRPVATILDRAETEHFHHHKKLYGTTPGQMVKRVGPPSSGLEVSISRSQASAVEFFRLL